MGERKGTLLLLGDGDDFSATEQVMTGVPGNTTTGIIAIKPRDKLSFTFVNESTSYTARFKVFTSNVEDPGVITTAANKKNWDYANPWIDITLAASGGTGSETTYQDDLPLNDIWLCFTCTAEDNAMAKGEAWVSGRITNEY